MTKESNNNYAQDSNVQSAGTNQTAQAEQMTTEDDVTTETPMPPLRPPPPHDLEAQRENNNSSLVDGAHDEVHDVRSDNSANRNADGCDPPGAQFANVSSSSSSGLEPEEAVAIIIEQSNARTNNNTAADTKQQVLPTYKDQVSPGPPHQMMEAPQKQRPPNYKDQVREVSSDPPQVERMSTRNTSTPPRSGRRSSNRRYAEYNDNVTTDEETHNTDISAPTAGDNRTLSITPLAAQVVADDDEHVAAQIRQQIIDNAVQAEAVTPIISQENIISPGRRKKQRLLLLGGGFLVIIAIAVAVGVLVGNDGSNPPTVPLTTTTSTSAAPTSPPPAEATTTEPDPSTNFCQGNSDCDPNMVCQTKTCISAGLLRFTLEWAGNEDLNLVVDTPEGSQISFKDPNDLISAGFYETAALTNGNFHIGNIVFPIEPSFGSYQYFVRSSDGGSAGSSTNEWTVSIYRNDILQATNSGFGPSQRFVFGFLSSFTSNEELYDAVDNYIAAAVSAESAPAMKYGHPMGSWDVSLLSNFGNAFSANRNPAMATFNEDLSRWNVSNAETMSGMFEGAGGFSGDLSSWDLGNVQDTSSMFRDATSFNGNLSTWNIGKVETMSFMFLNAKSFNGDLVEWDTSRVTNMQGVFYEASAFNGDLSRWNVSRVTSLFDMFLKASLFDSDLVEWDTSRVTNMQGMFYGASAFNGDLSRLNTSQVTNMRLMFFDTWNFNSDLSSWDVSRVTSMFQMLDYARAFRHDLCDWSPLLQDREVDVAVMFRETNCPDTSDPVLTADPAGPFCFLCNNSSSPLNDQGEG